MVLRVRTGGISLLLVASAVAQSSWSAPVFETALNSTATDTGPHVSFDGLTLYFASYRTVDWEIWASTRAYPGSAWSAPVQVTELGGFGADDQPFLAVGNLEVYFISLRAGGAGGYDILRATRAGPAVPWNPPTFVTELNSGGEESAFSLTADGLQAYFLSTGWGAPSWPSNAIFRATRASTALPFGTPALVGELATANTHRDCEISPDGLSIVYTEFLPAPTSRLKVLYATRPDLVSPFSAPLVWTEFDNVGTSLGVYSFTRSFAGDEAFLAAGFAAAAGGQEIMSTRRSVPYGAGCGGPSPLALTCDVPVLGANWNLITSNVDPLSPIAVTFFGQLQVALPLDFLGAIGCFANVDGLLGSLTSPAVGGTAQLTVAVPANLALMGFVLRTQSACLTLGNPFGLYTSNGMASTLGL